MELVKHPMATASGYEKFANSKFLPTEIYGDRTNSLGLNMNIHSQADDFIAAVQQYRDKQWQGGPIVDGKTIETDHHVSITSPQETSKQIGSIYWGDKQLADKALTSANKAYRAWREVAVEDRAKCLKNLPI